MTGLWTSDGVGDLMQERVEDRLGWAVLGIELGNLDAFRPELAYAQATLRRPQCECPTLQAVLGQFAVRDEFQFLQVHPLLSEASKSSSTTCARLPHTF